MCACVPSERASLVSDGTRVRDASERMFTRLAVQPCRCRPRRSVSFGAAVVASDGSLTAGVLVDRLAIN